MNGDLVGQRLLAVQRGLVDTVKRSVGLHRARGRSRGRERKRKPGEKGVGAEIGVGNSTHLREVKRNLRFHVFRGPPADAAVVEALNDGLAQLQQNKSVLIVLEVVMKNCQEAQSLNHLRVSGQ